jgi:serine/threonine-protein kinase
MSLSPGTRLGPYGIVAPLGAGGMGEVYRARDTRLGRTVAIKVLPAALAGDTQFRERFDREARTISALSHPHICTLHDVGEHDGKPFLVMEHLEGQTLAERLARGAIPLDEALAVATQITDALDAAHRRGIVHRDLKPANIMLTKSGAKLLDFGLAKSAAPAFAGSSVSIAPTVEQTPTAQGTILGTVQYMAPEQIEGAEADARTDIFAFGVILYEMLTGRKAFTGRTPASLIGAILKDQPAPILTAQPLAPASLDRTVRRCLAKDPDDRWQTARDLRAELQWVRDSGGEPLPARGPVPRRAWAWHVPWALVATALAVTLWWSLLRTPASTGVRRVNLTIPPTLALRGAGGDRLLAMSPDARHVAFVATLEGRHQIYLRSADRFDAEPVRGTEGGSDPFFSPDGQWLGFIADNALKKVSVGGGPPSTLAGAISRGAAWAPDDTIVFTAGAANGLSRVQAGGGPPERLTTLQPAERSHRWPSFLPGGKALLFSIQPVDASFDDGLVVVRSLETGDQRIIARGGMSPVYVATGHVVFARAGVLLALPFDARRLEATGAPVSILEGISTNSATGTAQFATAAGSLAYVPGPVSETRRELVWVDRSGRAQPASAELRPYTDAAISPDGSRFAVVIGGANSDIWIYDTRRGSLSRLTFAPSLDAAPVWTPDGRHVVFSGIRNGPMEIRRVPFDGSGTEESLLTAGALNLQGRSFHPTGGWLACDQRGDIFVMPLQGDRTLQPFIATPFTEMFPVFSPDGRWIAYQSDESGRAEIYVQSFPGPKGKWQVSTEGGLRPKWSPDGRELFFRSGNRMMAAAIAPGTAFAAGPPRVLFTGQFAPPYDVAADGRFLMGRDEQPAAPPHVSLVLNWFEEVRARTGTP